MDVDNNQYARVKVEDDKNEIIVPITSSSKPEIPDSLQLKWQKIADLIAEILNIPSGLIMKLNSQEIEVFISSHTKGNPYNKNDREKLGLGLYCETVVGRRQELHVPNALKLKYWKNNPDIKLGMISYLGLPVKWSDGEIFGTFCVLDNKENQYGKLYKDILYQFRDILESDLNQLLLYSELKNKLTDNELKVREVHHRIKNHFNILISSIRLQSQQINNNIEFQTILKDISNRIKAISLIHENLTMPLDTSNLPIKNYITQLSRYILSNFTESKIDLMIEADDIVVNPKISLPIGLIISELVTNSIKYGFHKIAEPRIKIRIKSMASNRLSILYSDNGVGLPPGFDFEQVDSFGMFFIRLLLEQLDSKMKIIHKQGFTCKFNISLQ